MPPLSGSPKQVAWANNLPIAILKEAAYLEDALLAAAIPSMLTPITDSTIWIAISDYKRPGMPLTARILRMTSPRLAKLQTVILGSLQQHEKLAYWFVPAIVSPEIGEQALAS
jgi:hypothetical protein